MQEKIGVQKWMSLEWTRLKLTRFVTHAKHTYFNLIMDKC